MLTVLPYPGKAATREGMPYCTEAESRLKPLKYMDQLRAPQATLLEHVQQQQIECIDKRSRMPNVI